MLRRATDLSPVQFDRVGFMHKRVSGRPVKHDSVSSPPSLASGVTPSFPSPWRRRYFALSHRQLSLFYFATQEDYIAFVNIGKPKGKIASIDLQNASVYVDADYAWGKASLELDGCSVGGSDEDASASASVGGRRRGYFELATPKRIYLFESEDMEEWCWILAACGVTLRAADPDVLRKRVHSVPCVRLYSRSGYLRVKRVGRQDRLQELEAGAKPVTSKERVWFCRVDHRAQILGLFASCEARHEEAVVLLLLATVRQSGTCSREFVIEVHDRESNEVFDCALVLGCPSTRVCRSWIDVLNRAREDQGGLDAVGADEDAPRRPRLTREERREQRRQQQVQAEAERGMVRVEVEVEVEDESTLPPHQLSEMLAAEEATEYSFPTLRSHLSEASPMVEDREGEDGEEEEEEAEDDDNDDEAKQEDEEDSPGPAETLNRRAKSRRFQESSHLSLGVSPFASRQQILEMYNMRRAQLDWALKQLLPDAEIPAAVAQLPSPLARQASPGQILSPPIDTPTVIENGGEEAAAVTGTPVVQLGAAAAEEDDGAEQPGAIADLQVGSTFFSRVSTLGDHIDEDALFILGTGCELLKMPRSRLASPRWTYVFLVPDPVGNFLIQWDSDRKKDIKDVTLMLKDATLVFGQQTPLFRKARFNEFRDREDLSFSLIDERRSIDFVCRSQEDFFRWASVLPALLRRNGHYLPQSELFDGML